MNRRAAVLFIVEGKNTEPDFLRGIGCVEPELDCDICSVCTNIHILYETLRKGGFGMNIVDVIRDLYNRNIDDIQGRLDEISSSMESHHEVKRLRKELRLKQKERQKLERSYSAIYLIFDSEFQHADIQSQGQSHQSLIEKNYQRLKDMALYFNNETDPTRGKLYLNYPMMESFRDCNYPGDPKYQYAFVHIEVIFRKQYKRDVGRRHPQMVALHADRLTRDDFMSLAWMNVCKLHQINGVSWSVPMYEHYCAMSQQDRILDLEYQLIRSNQEIAVLNTSTFFLVDYYGEDYYERYLQRRS